MHAILAIGNGEVAVLRIVFGQDGSCESTLVTRVALSDIKLLSCQVAWHEISDGNISFDILAGNGRAEMIKATYVEGQGIDAEAKVVFKADQKIQFTAVQRLTQVDRLVCGDTRGHLWLFNYSTGEKLYSVKSHADRITGLDMRQEDGAIIASSKDSFVNVYSCDASASSLAKQESIKCSALTIIYEVNGTRMLGFNGLYCLFWDREQDLCLLKVNTKGGNRPVRAWYG